MINTALKNYIENNIFTAYNDFDKAHGLDHIKTVIENSLNIAADYDVNIEMVYTIAAFHDIGLSVDREKHHIHSANILMQDKFIERTFSLSQRVLMKEAVEDHRASNSHEPRSIYGRIVSEADRDLNYDTIIKRVILYGIKKFPDFSFEEQYGRCHHHIVDKYGENGYIKLWLETKDNKRKLEIIRKNLRNEAQFKEHFLTVYNEIVK